MILILLCTFLGPDAPLPDARQELIILRPCPSGKPISSRFLTGWNPADEERMTVNVRLTPGRPFKSEDADRLGRMHGGRRVTAVLCWSHSPGLWHVCLQHVPKR